MTVGTDHAALTAGSHPGEVYQVRTRVIDVGDGTYSATFTPTVAGTHYVAVMLGRQHVCGSPFKLPVRLPDKAPVSADQCKVTGDGAEGAVAGEVASFSIQVGCAGCAGLPRCQGLHAFSPPSPFVWVPRANACCREPGV